MVRPAHHPEPRRRAILNDLNSNDQNREPLGFCFEHWIIRILKLFRISDFEIRIWLRPKICIQAEE